MRLLWPALAPVLVLFSLACRADPAIHEVPITILHPGQGGTGMAVFLRNLFNPLLAQFHGNAAEALASKKMASARAVIAPDGRPWITDGHNRILLRWKLAKLAGKLKQTRVKIKVEEGDDFTGRPWDEFYQALESRNLVHLDREVRARDIPLAEKMRTLPADFGEFEASDKPIRGVVEEVFRRLGIDPKKMINFAELLFGDRLEDAGLHLGAGGDLAPEVFDRAMALTLRPENAAYLETLANRPAYAQKLREILLAEGVRMRLCQALAPQSGP